jgi:chloramphenicol O-acetyltransferase
MSNIWPKDVIRELLALAEAQGSARAEVGTEREAELFRFAIYAFRRQTNLGQNLTIDLDNGAVVVTKRASPQITIVHPEETTDA